MTKDPVCGMVLDEEKAPYKFEYEGAVYYFCGLGCRERFKKNPRKYLEGKADWIEDGE